MRAFLSTHLEAMKGAFVPVKRLAKREERIIFKLFVFLYKLIFLVYFLSIFLYKFDIQKEDFHLSYFLYTKMNFLTIF